MNASTSVGVNSDASNSSTVADTINRFTDSVERLAESLDAPEEVVSEVTESAKELAHVVEANAENVAANREQIEDNEAGIDDNAEQIESVDSTHGENITGCHARITSVKDDLDEIDDQLDGIDSDEGNVDADTRGVEPDEPASTTPETPLETVIAMDDATATTELTANTKRARFVAKDIEEYARSVPAGYAIKSGDVSTILKSGTECRGSTKTVARVMEFLADLGNDEVEIVQKRGVNRVILSDEIVERISEIEADDEVVMATTSKVVV